MRCINYCFAFHTSSPTIRAAMRIDLAIISRRCLREGQGRFQEVPPVPFYRQVFWCLPRLRHRPRQAAETRRCGHPVEHAVADEGSGEAEGQSGVKRAAVARVQPPSTEQNALVERTGEAGSHGTLES